MSAGNDELSKNGKDLVVHLYWKSLVQSSFELQQPVKTLRIRCSSKRSVWEKQTRYMLATPVEVAMDVRIASTQLLFCVIYNFIVDRMIARQTA